MMDDKKLNSKKGCGLGMDGGWGTRTEGGVRERWVKMRKIEWEED